ncbi:HAD-IA family hydrolase [Novosphingobium sp.]|uniref:HAD-IA family hydrolase n=1 Tax=Novosphingobium sp. TaxID=1874826 RepID=UPI0025E4DA2D|nr:HAD-IA family hydrolase [Novosphingobium sp.]MCC6925338.1 HAD-IA family hydrolase [Novosphingobium sp.]
MTIPFDIVGFDLDGTLLDTSRDLGVALNHALTTIGRPEVPYDQVRNLIGGGSGLMLRRALALTGGDEGIDFEALRQVLVRFYGENIAHHTALFPGGEAMLDDLAAAGVKVAVVTNKPHALAIRLFDELGLSPRFASVIGGGTFPLKPEPDALHAMVEQCGGGRAAFVGDTTFDTGAARAAGMPCVAVSFGFVDAPLDELGADAVIDHFDQLVPALCSL